MAQLKTFLKFLGSAFLRVLACILVGTLLLFAVYAIPTAPMEDNMASSAAYLAETGKYPVLHSWCTSQLDHFTDSIILLNATCGTDLPIPVQAMTVTQNAVGDLEPFDSMAAHYVDGQAFDGQHPYYQYWHGYLVFIKPLLLLTDYQGIGIMNLVLQCGLLAVLFWLMVKKGLAHYIPAYLVSFLFLVPVAQAVCIQFATCHYILTLGSILVLLLADHLDKWEAWLFLYLGIATAYFDFLTYPLATLGVPAVFYCLVRGPMTVLQSLQRGIKVCFSWGFGYGFMWAGKWAVGSIVTGTNIFTAALSKVAERSSLNAGPEYGIADSLYANLLAFLSTPALIGALIPAAVCLVLLLLRRRSFRLSRALPILFPFLILALLPIVWYVVTANHSTIHYWFTHKSLVVSAFAGLAALTMVCQEAT